MSSHPLLHPKLKNFSFCYSFGDLIGSESQAMTFLEEVGLIPSQTSQPPKCCGSLMSIKSRSDKKFGWIWECSSKKSKKKGSKDCRKTINPGTGTFFDGQQCHIKFCDVLAIIIFFVLDTNITDVFKHLQGFRRSRNDPEVSTETIGDYYSYCREIAEVIASHSNEVLGGEGKTVQVDETFLTKRKYHRGRLTEQMTITVLGIYCVEDKTGLFFKVNSKKKSDLWPYVKRFVHPDTSTICSDSARQWHGVNNIVGEKTVHKQTDHSKGEYVSKTDKNNTINHLENENKLLKRVIKCRRSAASLHQYMAFYFYKKKYLKQWSDMGSQIMQFLEDIKKVYPGYVNGEYNGGLTINEIDPPTVESEHLEDFIPPKRARFEQMEDEESDLTIDDEIALAESDQEEAMMQ